MRSLSSPDLLDCELVRYAQEGNAEYFRKLIERYDNRLSRIVRKHTRNEASADDLCQEIHLLVWRKLNTLRDPCKFWSWYYRVALNAVKSWNRKPQIQLKSLEDDVMANYASSEPDPGDIAISNELFKEALRAVPPRTREVLRRHLCGERHEEIARELKLELGTVDVYCRNGMKKLREALRQLTLGDQEKRKEGD